MRKLTRTKEQTNKTEKISKIYVSSVTDKYYRVDMDLGFNYTMQNCQLFNVKLC